MITLARVDERLIHGQVAYSWTKAYPSDAVIAIDSQSAKDDMQKTLLKMACPKNMKCFVASEEQSVEILNKYPNKKFFLVAKHPKSYLYLLEHGIKTDSVNVGGIYFKEGRKQYTNTVYLDEETKDIILKIHDKGVYIDGRTTPSDPELDLICKF